MVGDTAATSSAVTTASAATTIATTTTDVHGSGAKPGMTVAEAQRRVEAFLTGQMVEAPRSIENRLPPFNAEPGVTSLADAARGKVMLRHVIGASDCTYLVAAFGDALVVQIQLDVYRFIVVYRVPARDTLDAASLQPRLER